jgi:large subunit ribosomal protein L25
MDTLKAEKRTMDVKAKKLRREGYVIGNMFGKKIEGSIPVQMHKKDVDMILKTSGRGSQIMLDVDGQVYDVLIKDIAYNPLAGRIDDIDFQALVSNEKVNSVAEVVPVDHEKIAEGVLQVEMGEIYYRALPADLVDKIRIDVGRMKIGDVICVKDLEIASNPKIELLADPEAPVVSVTAIRNAPVPENETEEGEAAEE